MRTLKKLLISLSIATASTATMADSLSGLRPLPEANYSNQKVVEDVLAA